MKALWIASLLLCFGLFAQDNNGGEQLETNLDQTLEEMQVADDFVDEEVQAAETVDALAADPSIGSKDEGLFDRLMNRMKEKLSAQVKGNPFRHMSALQVENIIIDRTKDNMLGSYLAESPRVMYFVVNFLRDEFAMPQVLEIFKREKDLKIYSYFVLGNLVFFFLLGWYYDRKSQSGLIKTFFRKLFFIILSTLVSTAVFYVMFHKELKPTVGIASEAITKPL